MITRRTAWALAISFLLIILIPPAAQCIHEVRTTGHWRALDVFRRAPTATNLRNYGDDLERQSALAERVRTAYSGLLIPDLQRAAGNVIVGTDGFLFYKPDVEFCTQRGMLSPTFPNSQNFTRAVTSFNEQLKSRGIRLLLLPIPAKTAIYPEKLSPAYATSNGPALNPDLERWLAELRSAGIDVVDPTADFWSAKKDGQPLFLKSDTHWTPQGCALTAKLVADRVGRWLNRESSSTYSSEIVQTSVTGDLAKLLGLSGDASRYPPERVEVTQVIKSKAASQPGSPAPVLLIGDSFCTMYEGTQSQGGNAGLGHQLMLRLGVEVQTVAGVAGPDFAGPRESLAQNPDLMRGRQVIIWEFATRLLWESPTWGPVNLPTPTR